jgi:hypothetical protein
MQIFSVLLFAEVLANILILLKILFKIYEISFPLQRYRMFLRKSFLNKLHLVHKMRATFYFFLSFFHLLTCVYIVWATALLTPRTCSTLLYNFVEEKSIKDNKKNMAFFPIKVLNPL